MYLHSNNNITIKQPSITKATNNFSKAVKKTKTLSNIPILLITGQMYY